MNNFSFLDNPPNINMPRTAPSPTSSQASQQPNGMNGPQQNGVPMVNGLPSGGQQTDINHLWGVIQQLSQLLEENRAQTLGIVNGVQAIQARAAEEGGGVANLGMREVNGELNAATRTQELQSLQSQLSSAQRTASDLTDSNSQLHGLLTDYENAVTLLLDKLRPYAYNQTQAILSLHKHYQSLLEQERATSMQVRLEHAEWQAGLGRVAEYARQALKEQGEADEPWKRELKELKEENRVLRQLAGWEEREESSEEEDEGERQQ